MAAVAENICGMIMILLVLASEVGNDKAEADCVWMYVQAISGTQLNPIHLCHHR